MPAKMNVVVKQKNDIINASDHGSNANTLFRIFISWAGDYSKAIAIALKSILEEEIFSNNLECFVSELDIASGSDWWDKIKDELCTCQYCIVCMTNENVRAPWIFYEAGAMVARDVPTVPFLVNCSVNSLDHTPLTGKQTIKFYDQPQFVKMVKNINELMGTQLSSKQVGIIAETAYKKLRDDLEPVVSKLKETVYFSDRCIYPSNISCAKRRTVYISAPMASISADEYKNIHEYSLELRDILKMEFGFKHAESPLFSIEDPDKFELPSVAVANNFEHLKQVDTIIVIYPQNVPSSILVELGYSLAISKRVIIFYHGELPYMLREIGQAVHHVNTIPYSTYSEISKIIRQNGDTLFKEVK